MESSHHPLPGGITETTTWNCTELDHIRDIEIIATDGLTSTYRRVGACYECKAIVVETSTCKILEITDFPLDFIYNEVEHYLNNQFDKAQVEKILEEDAEIAEFILGEILESHRPAGTPTAVCSL